MSSSFFAKHAGGLPVAVQLVHWFPIMLQFMHDIF